MTYRVFKCPSCGYKFRADPRERYDSGEVTIIKGDARDARDLREVRERGLTVDLTCPNCKREFEVDVGG